MSFLSRSAGGRMSIGGIINKHLTGSSKSLLEQAIYPRDPKTGNRSFGPLAYGAFYSSGTYIGYAGNYLGNNRTKYYNTPTFYLNSDNKMPYNRYGRYYRRYGRRYNRYSGRYSRGRRYYRRYF